MKNFTINTKNNILSITIDKVFSINSIVELKNTIQEKLSKIEKVECNLKNIEVIDISAIQLIYSLKQELKNRKITFSIKHNIEENMLNILSKSNVLRLIEN